jgi:hypothetical protein
MGGGRHCPSIPSNGAKLIVGREIAGCQPRTMRSPTKARPAGFEPAIRALRVLCFSRASCRTPGAAQARRRNTFRQPESVRDVPNDLRRGFPLLMGTTVAFIGYLPGRYSTASASFLDNVVLCAGKPRRYGLPCPSEQPCRYRRRCFSLSSRYPSSSAASRHFS